MIAAGALVFLAGCSGDDAGGSGEPAAATAKPAEVSLALADGSVDVPPLCRSRSLSPRASWPT